LDQGLGLLSVAVAKPRTRTTDAKPKTGPVKDSFQNLAARLGVGALGSGVNNIASAANYQLNPVTRERASLEYMYRGSWIAGIAVDAVARDGRTHRRRQCTDRWRAYCSDWGFASDG
jgi:hypothetical protein